ncbi:acetoacetate decarboxylase [Trinickia violacea]|uniref:Acetoacetate decarboxylase n=1 Tax=Trinickia violacea TaxID=2571746 RepID=A0A4P8IWF3_9BURK|nr:NAD(P)-binding protein [Trinickia violacea]QCP52776.1 acetoacetate decarboxylase [Trinickia violacea]
MAEYPAYIYTSGSPLQHTPMHLNASDMYGFFIKGDLEKLQETVDATLNRVAANRMTFRALSPYIMLTFTRVEHAQSSFPADYNKGWGKECDIIPWILVGQVEENDGNTKLHRVFLYPSYTWVDVPMAISIGREIFGYPKNICQLSMPEPGDDPLAFKISCEGWEPYSPETQLDVHPLIEIAATDTGKTHQPVSGFFDVIREGLKILRSEPDLFALDEAGLQDFESLLLRPRIDQLFLKQFPDASGVKAVYQAVVVAPAVIDKVYEAELLGYTYACTVHKFDTFRLDETLGLELGTQPVLLPFHIKMDFTVTEGEELLEAAATSPQKIAILGGGPGAMTAAFYLTDQPNWQDRYDITVYQMGWRLGGKCASGRNARLGQRIEEHGLHMWFGFYDNGFALMKKAYGALNRPASAPLATWQDAFKPQNYIVLTESIGEGYKFWPIQIPEKPGDPGEHNEEITFEKVVTTLTAWIRQWLKGLDQCISDAAKAEPEKDAKGLGPFWEGFLGLLKHVPEAFHFLEKPNHESLLGALRTIQDSLLQRVEHLLDSDDEARRFFISIDLAVTSLIGMQADGVLLNGFDVINDIEFRDWLRKHGANQDYTIDSAPVRGFYDLVFAYLDGDTSRPNIEAGTMLRGILRIAIGYHGGFIWKMQAGMGDTVFTPLYQVLKQRGVNFQFFHKVETLIPDGDGVGEIVMTQQVALADGMTEYNPLIDVADLACWPSYPNYGQIDTDQARLLQANDVNLESHWSDWAQIYEAHFGRPLPVKQLKRGVDFDQVVFGLSIGSLPQVCQKLLEKSPPLKATSDNVKTTATRAYQVWLNKSLRELGWAAFGSEAEDPVLSSFSEPFDTSTPMNQLLIREVWPAGHAPQNVSYFCSPMRMPDVPPHTETDFLARCTGTVKLGALGQLRQQAFNLWPAVATEDSFDWQALIDPDNNSGEARFDAQYWRANVNPSDRYVLSVVGSTQHRLASDASGFSNLYLAGDWLKTGLNAGCVEAAVMGGMQASRAISGYPCAIKGETDR